MEGFPFSISSRNMTPEQENFDVAILGGGLSGLTLAKQLSDQHSDLRILVLERREFPVPESGHKVGESTIEVGAHYLAERIGLKKHLVDDQLPKFGLRFFFGGGEESFEDALEVGLTDFFPTPGYQIDRGRLENHLVEMIREEGVKFVEKAKVKEIDLREGDEDHVVDYQRNGELHRAAARWVVDASGRTALLKRKLDLYEEVPHKVNAAWFRLDGEICVDCWSDDSEWKARTGKVPRRWLSTNHLLGKGYWIWIIPLATGATSIGIVADPDMHPLSEFNRFEKAFAWIQEHEPQCAKAIEPFRDSVLDFRAIKQIAHGCRQLYSADRWAITGEAGVFLDPLYSPGIDYIAMANLQICSMIEHDLEGESLRLIAPRYQGLFLQLFQDNLRTYQDQYPIFGNPRAMSLKYVWDYAIYWGFPALLYFNDKLTDPGFFSRVGETIESIRQLNIQMQQFFRDWDAADTNQPAATSFINQNEITILSQLNGELRERLDDAELDKRIRRNAVILSELAGEIIARGGLLATDQETAPAPPKRGGRLGEVFESLGI